MLKIYGADLSAPANKVRFAANALGLKYEYVRVSIKNGENRKEEFLKLHPAGKIPVIDDDGFVLFESGAIIKYLAVKNSSALYPDGVRQRALVDQWMDFTAIHLGGAIGKVLFNRVFAPFAGVAVDERSIEDGQRFLSRFLPVIDQQLKENRYLAGEEFSLADISLLATVDPAEVAQVDVSAHTCLARWRDTLRKKAFYMDCHKKYGEALSRLASG